MASIGILQAISSSGGTCLVGPSLGYFRSPGGISGMHPGSVSSVVSARASLNFFKSWVMTFLSAYWSLIWAQLPISAPCWAWSSQTATMTRSL